MGDGVVAVLRYLRSKCSQLLTRRDLQVARRTAEHVRIVRVEPTRGR